MPGRFFLLYVFSFLLAALLGAALTFLSRAAALRLGALDRPSGRKDHSHPIPASGGWAVFATFTLLAGAGGLLAPALASRLPESFASLSPYLENLSGQRAKLLAILSGLTLIFVVGVVDDFKPLGPRIKLAAQILAALPLILTGVVIQGFLPWPPLSWALTALWAVALMNAFNFIDNMDGVCAIVAGAIALSLAAAAAMGGQLLLPALLLLFAGALAGFLVFNFHPASIFLGDSGSMTIGYLMAVFSIMTTYYGAESPTGLPVLIPFAAMGVPLFDAASVLFIRWRAGRPLMVGDQNHFSHRLKAMGLSVRQVGATLGMLAASTGLLSLALRHLGLAEAALHLLALAMLFAVIGTLEFAGRKRAKSAEKPPEN